MGLKWMLRGFQSFFLRAYITFSVNAFNTVVRNSKRCFRNRRILATETISVGTRESDGNATENRRDRSVYTPLWRRIPRCGRIMSLEKKKCEVATNTLYNTYIYTHTGSGELCVIRRSRHSPRRSGYKNNLSDMSLKMS